MLKNFLDNYEKHEATETSPVKPLKIENKTKAKNIYAAYQNRTNGTRKESALFQNITYTNKSKYDNVVGWIRTKK